MATSAGHRSSKGASGMFQPELMNIYEPAEDRRDTATVIWCHGGGSQPQPLAVLAPTFSDRRFVLPNPICPVCKGLSGGLRFRREVMNE